MALSTGETNISPTCPVMKIELDRVVLKWVFGAVVVREGEVKPGDKDWLSQCKLYMKTLGLNAKSLGGFTAIYWKCPRHVFPLFHGHCPGVKVDTVLNDNKEINAVLMHCLHYKACFAMLHVGPDPKKQRETNPLDLADAVSEWQRCELLQYTTWFGVPFARLKNKAHTAVKRCRYCGATGHNKKTCRRKRFYARKMAVEV